MKRFYLFSFLFILSAFCIGIVVGYQWKSNHTKLQQVNQLAQEKSVDEYAYYVKADGDQIVVYLEDGTTVYEYTDIVLSSLPESMQSEVIEGIYMKDDAQLYDFLESYSS